MVPCARLQVDFGCRDALIGGGPALSWSAFSRTGDFRVVPYSTGFQPVSGSRDLLGWIDYALKSIQHTTRPFGPRGLDASSAIFCKKLSFNSITRTQTLFRFSMNSVRC
jgi:hypothetical protein